MHENRATSSLIAPAIRAAASARRPREQEGRDHTCLGDKAASADPRLASIRSGSIHATASSPVAGSGHGRRVCAYAHAWNANRLEVLLVVLRDHLVGVGRHHAIRGRDGDASNLQSLLLADATTSKTTELAVAQRRSG